ncbi:Sec-independent protein translocase protein TatB [Pseudonocardia humida]|uniref:Sec-independent protein translocase protein TatB n=1 Tax=Pseudonocardia humida TaxID=2800819 RepID=A0ABT1A3H3_9PSEU|nr:Sec-independent protein translocase protein TatB [Pseudonocardia humida]MCO1657542.1 Sec-independent protein translocase subunit TatB [Pseudonocardia humida]
MFDSVGWGEIVVLIVAGLFILGPERLPGAAAWLGRTIRQVREYATGARDQLKGELGPEFDELRKPLEELRGLRSFNPRTAATTALFRDDPVEKPNGHAPGAGLDLTKGSNSTPASLSKPAAQPKLEKNERPPIDPDAT